MFQQTPIACLLNGNELPERYGVMAALGTCTLIDVRREPAGTRLRFVARVGIRDRLAAIVRAESRCCPFLTFELLEEPEVIVLTIQGPPHAKVVVEDIVAALSGRAVA